MTSGAAKVFKLDSLINELRESGEGYFIDFLRIRHLEAGIIVLAPGQDDTQTPHDSDELYYVVRGTASMELGTEVRKVGPGSIVFVPSKMNHRFFGNREELVVLYIFAEE